MFETQMYNNTTPGYLIFLIYYCHFRLNVVLKTVHDMTRNCMLYSFVLEEFVNFADYLLRAFSHEQLVKEFFI